MPPFASTHTPVPFPALYLYPLNDSFIPKHISLISNQRVKIGRQTNAKTVPAERNGFFDSKVLSRQHAEVWEENGKVRRAYRVVHGLRPASSHPQWACHDTSEKGLPLIHTRRYGSKTSRAQTARSLTARD